MGCSDSKSAQYRAEADDYAARKKNGFKDPQLEKVGRRGHSSCEPVRCG